MDQYLRGLSLLIDEDYDGSLRELNAAVDADGSNPEFFSKRAALHAKLKDFEASLRDAQAALKLDDSHAVAQMRKGVACFQLERYKDAVQAFKSALEGLQGKQADNVRTWIRKCNAELEEDVALEPEPSSPAQPELTTDSELRVVESALKEAANAPKRPSRYTHEWYQSMSHVTVEVLAKDIPEDALNVEIKPNTLELQISLPGNETVSYDWELFGTVDPEKSKVTVTKRKVEIRLKKTNESIHWPTLEGTGDESAGTAVTVSAPSGTSAPGRVSAYASGKNWDALEKELAEEEANEKPEGDEALNKLFRDIYKDASEETRRAMIKSYQTSGGTVLSTNWDEVAKKDYEKERPAPKGMQWKNWEGEKLEVGDDEDDDK